MQKRMETLEKHRKPAAAEPAAPAPAKETAPAPRVRTVYKVAAASALPPQSKPAPANNAAPVVNVPSGPSNAEIANEGMRANPRVPSSQSAPGADLPRWSGQGRMTLKR